jgi:hypothetical protein
VKLLYAIASALFCVAAAVAAPAQSLDLSLSSALCSDDYYDDTAGQRGAISAGEVLTIEAILAKYGVVLTPTSDDELIVLYLDDLDDMPVGSVQPRNEEAASTDEKLNAEPANEQETIASKVITLEQPSEIGGEVTDDIAMTGPTTRLIPAAVEPVEDTRTIE